MKNSRKFYSLLCSLVISCVMFFSSVPVNVFAQTYEPVNFIWMSGSESNGWFQEEGAWRGFSTDGLAVVRKDRSVTGHISTLFQVSSIGSPFYVSIFTEVGAFNTSVLKVYNSDFTVSSELSLTFSDISNGDLVGYWTSFEVPSNFFSITNSSSGYYSISISREPVSSDSEIDKLISVIQEQTDILSSEIGSASERITNAIDNQYSGTPGDVIDVPGIEDQINEKLGVLSFAHDTMTSFVDIFETPSGRVSLTLPGFSIPVEGVSYSVWSDQTFYLDQLDGWFGGLMSIIRTVLPIMVWLAVLNYCIKVADDFFGGDAG